MWRRGRGRAGGVAPASRDRVVSAAPSIPAASGDSWSAMPFSSARVAPKLSLSSGAYAPGLWSERISALWQSSLSSRELCLKSLLVRPSQSTSGLSLSDDAMSIALVGWLNLRFALSVVGFGSPVATWSWSVQGGSGRPRRPCSERVVAARALSSTCMPSALRLSQSAPPVLCPSVPLHPRACACVVPTLGWPAGGLRELCSVFGARVKMLTVCARSFEMGLEPRLIT